MSTTPTDLASKKAMGDLMMRQNMSLCRRLEARMPTSKNSWVKKNFKVNNKGFVQNAIF